MKTEKVFITPEMALEMLEKNQVNRTLLPETVKAYARAMRAGEWKLTHQGLLIGANDNVIDGQHRLMAVYVSKVPQWFLVSRDPAFASAVDAPIDIGRKRDAGFSLGISKELAAVAKFAFITLFPSVKTTLPSDFEYLAKITSPYLDSLNNGKRILRGGITSAPIMLAGITQMMLGGDKEYIAHVYNAMRNNIFDQMPPIAASFYKQTVVDRARYESRQSFSRAMKVFDIEQKNTTKLQVKNEAYAYEEARKLLAKAVHSKTQNET